MILDILKGEKIIDDINSYQVKLSTMQTTSRYIIRQLFLALLLCIPLQATANESPGMESGQQEFNHGNLERSFALWQIDATRGNTNAQVFVGLSYANGWGVSKSPELASIWYKKAAINNNTSGQFLLGLHYIQQHGATRAAGLSWLKLAAEGGDADARAFLKKGFEKGWFKDIGMQDTDKNASQTDISLTHASEH